LLTKEKLIPNQRSLLSKEKDSLKLYFLSKRKVFKSRRSLSKKREINLKISGEENKHSRCPWTPKINPSR